jgi:hypothetical protein
MVVSRFKPFAIQDNPFVVKSGQQLAPINLYTFDQLFNSPPVAILWLQQKIGIQADTLLAYRKLR